MTAASLEKRKFYRDDPLWRMPDPAPATQMAPRKLSEYYDFFENALFRSGEVARAGEILPSQGINTVDEVPDSAWYTNRHGFRRMSLEELTAGPGISKPPAPGPWTIVAAKNEGITPGFTIRDTRGRIYFIKFDPLSNPEMASAADVISSKFFYALGYNVPENYIAWLDRGQLVIDGDAMLKDSHGRKRPVTERDVETMLARAPRSSDGRYRVLASLALQGQPVGPFRYYGVRRDDPNDLVPHEHRRDLRGLRTFGAWLGHDDSKALNTLDMLVKENGVPFVKHYLIDFGATLGSATFEPNSPRSGNTYLFAWKSAASQLFSLGLYAPRWQHARYPKLPATGRFEYEVFDPERWVPEYPNAAFRNSNPADQFWAARKVMAFTDEEIRAIVSTGQYTDAAAAEWVARCLIERRDKIVEAFTRGPAALDRFAVRGRRLEFRNLGTRPGAASVLRVTWSEFDNRRGTRRALAGASSFAVPQVSGTGYLVADITGDSGAGVAVFLSSQAGEIRVIGIERNFGSVKKDSPAYDGLIQSRLD
jgi:hypothetical protein